MNEKKDITRDSIIVGFALFATFFGAGNLIFPPSIGAASGTSWLPGLLGLIATGIILPILSVLAVSNAGGSFEQLSRPMSKWFNTVFNLFAMLAIATSITIPRTAATTHELGIAPLLPGVPIIVTSVAFFALNFYFANDKSNVIDKIGKILTPALLIILLIIVATGIIAPVGSPSATGIENPFTSAFLEAYQTGDLLTGLLCATVFISMIHGKGYIDESSKKKVTFNAAIISAIGLIIVYGGLLYIGASGNSLFPADTNRAALLIGLVEKLLGRAGVTGLSIAVVLACLTTAIGITASVADFMSSFTRGKISYRIWVGIVCIVGIFQSSMGVEAIINLAGPFFFACYPIAILLTLFGLFKKYIPNDGAYKGAGALVLIVSLMESLTVAGIKSSFIEKILAAIPLSQYGFAWLIPAIAGFIAGALIFKLTPQSKKENI